MSERIASFTVSVCAWFGWNPTAARARPVRPPVIPSALFATKFHAAKYTPSFRSPELEQRLETETRAAIARGVFGVPTIFVGDEMFWGNDRFELVRFYLQKASQP